MQPLIPPYIQRSLGDDCLTGELTAFTLNVDLSGFTPLTESLMRQGVAGAERLSEVLNDIFTPLVSIVYSHGGFIPYFAGDAFTAVFDLSLNHRNAMHLLRTAEEVRQVFLEHGNVFGEGYTIGIKAGLAAGTVHFGIVGNDYKAFYFRGEAIDRAAHCQTVAQESEVVVDHVINVLVEGRSVVTEAIDIRAYRVLGQIKASARNPEVRPLSLPDVNEEIARAFLPAEVVRYDQAGEFRTVISAFLSFTEVHTHEELNAFASIVLDQASDFGGYFKEVDYGDKGALMVVFFGAPVSYENNAVRALEFALSVEAGLDGLRTRSGSHFQYRFGATIGTAFTGIVGGKERCQYACVGSRVNLAARIMGEADWGEILVDEELANVSQFRFALKGNIHYKGIDASVPTFSLTGRRQSIGKPEYGGELVGRHREVEQLVTFSERQLREGNIGLAYVRGEAGIGKSRLTDEVRRQLAEGGTKNWLLATSDQILRKPFNPFTYLLRQVFRQRSELGGAQNLRRFQYRVDKTLQQLAESDHPAAPSVSEELGRTKSILAALIGIIIPNSLWNQLDAQGRYQNTIAAIVNFLMAESIIRPTVLELEDTHWIDNDSSRVIREFLERSQKLGMVIIATARPEDEGDYENLFAPDFLESRGVETINVEIAALEPDAVREFAEGALGKPITKEFLQTLLRTTNSNPFYLEQVLEYFQENDLMIKEGEVLTLKDESIRLSSSITSILTARIDRLSDMVRDIVKAAAVIGREFELPVLREVLRDEVDFASDAEVMQVLRKHIEVAEKGKIWSAMNELRYIFRHSLLREAVYGMQLTTRLQQLHKQIAQAIEKIYCDNIEERYVDLAFHYEQSGVADKTIEYLTKAANYARANYRNQQALELYGRLATKLSGQRDQNLIVDIYLNQGQVLEIIGDWDEALKTYHKAQRIAKSSRDIILLGRTNNRLGYLYTLQGQHETAMEHLETAANLFESVDDIFGISRSYSNIGHLHFRKAQYSRALTHYQKSLDNGLSGAGTASSAGTVSHLGLTYMNLGRYEEAIRVIEEQLPLHETNGDSAGLATLHTNLGIVYFESGNYDKAREHHETGLDLSRELGNKRLQAIGLGSLGSVYERQGKYQRALDLFLQDLRICNELGDKQGIAVTEGLLGELYSVMGKFTTAISHLDHSLSLSSELDYRKGVAKAVNTLGDIYYLQKRYELSLEYYDRAIAIARETHNRLVLASSLHEKGMALLEDGRYGELKRVQKEALKLAKDLGNPDLLFDSQLLHARSLAAINPLDNTKAIEAVEALLEDEALNDEQRAEANLAIFTLSGGLQEKARETALRLYEGLYLKTPKFIYNYYLSLLRGETLTA